MATEKKTPQFLELIPRLIQEPINFDLPKHFIENHGLLSKLLPHPGLGIAGTQSKTLNEAPRHVYNMSEEKRDDNEGPFCRTPDLESQDTVKTLNELRDMCNMARKKDDITRDPSAAPRTWNRKDTVKTLNEGSRHVQHGEEKGTTPNEGPSDENHGDEIEDATVPGTHPQDTLKTLNEVRDMCNMARKKGRRPTRTMNENHGDEKEDATVPWNSSPDSSRTVNFDISKTFIENHGFTFLSFCRTPDLESQDTLKTLNEVRDMCNMARKKRRRPTRTINENHGDKKEDATVPGTHPQDTLKTLNEVRDMCNMARKKRRRPTRTINENHGDKKEDATVPGTHPQDDSMAWKTIESSSSPLLINEILATIPFILSSHLSTSYSQGGPLPIQKAVVGGQYKTGINPPSQLIEKVEKRRRAPCLDTQQPEGSLISKLTERRSRACWM
ncbi:unnamed protein product [Caenorhabditis auriculariae]|uniref:Uncharacterized protein n=1 Tax=Caenorhabditis auriculariae TaxID=2777116 RepID=A0A8S1GVN2_9PELO|nr:unnamed protein product [Caenorhabditis auriculariae]